MGTATTGFRLSQNTKIYEPLDIAERRIVRALRQLRPFFTRQCPGKIPQKPAQNEALPGIEWSFRMAIPEFDAG
jgi:hypothetical protein